MPKNVTQSREKPAEIRLYPAFWLEQEDGLWRGVYGRINPDSIHSERILVSEWSTKSTAVDYLSKTMLLVRRDLEVKIGKPTGPRTYKEVK